MPSQQRSHSVVSSVQISRLLSPYVGDYNLTGGGNLCFLLLQCPDMGMKQHKVKSLADREGRKEALLCSGNIGKGI